MAIHLPNSLAADPQRRQPTTAMTVCIEANDVAQIDDLRRFLGRMPDDGDLTVFVRRRQVKMQVLPKQQIIGLLVERNIRRIVGVYEKMRRNLVIAFAAANEVQILRRNVIELTFVDSQRGITA